MLVSSIILGIWFLIPIGVANSVAVPGIANRIPLIKKLNYPMDFGYSLGGIRIFGNNKTFRGLIIGMIAGVIASILLHIIFDSSQAIRELLDYNYSKTDAILLGALSGAGALIGDAVESFFKRRVGIPPGGMWVPFDQIDYLIGGILFLLPFGVLPLTSYISLVLVGAALHPVSNIASYYLGLKDRPW